MPEPAQPLTFIVKIELPAMEAERVASALEAAAHPAADALSLFERDNGQVEILAHYSDEPSRAALAELLHEAEGNALAGLSIEPLTPRDWVAASESRRGPVSLGRFYLHGGHDRHRAPRRRGRIEIDAGLAFGTGLHASTQGCLIALDRLLKRGKFRTIVDIGTGTGVLAIAAAKAGSASLPLVLAGDVDPSAVGVARENARANGVAPRVHILQSLGFDHPALRRIRADLVLANLTPPVLKLLAPELTRRLVPGGMAILSGIDAGRAPEVEARYRAMGFFLQSRVLIDGWTTLVLAASSRRRLRPD
jgi:ribosomal protein L11 methyltransferase